MVLDDWLATAIPDEREELKKYEELAEEHGQEPFGGTHDEKLAKYRKIVFDFLDKEEKKPSLGAVIVKDTEAVFTLIGNAFKEFFSPSQTKPAPQAPKKKSAGLKFNAGAKAYVPPSSVSTPPTQKQKYVVPYRRNQQQKQVSQNSSNADWDVQTYWSKKEWDQALSTMKTDRILYETLFSAVQSLRYQGKYPSDDDDYLFLAGFGSSSMDTIFKTHFLSIYVLKDVNGDVIEVRPEWQLQEEWWRKYGKRNGILPYVPPPPVAVSAEEASDPVKNIRRSTQKKEVIRFDDYDKFRRGKENYIKATGTDESTWRSFLALLPPDDDGNRLTPGRTSLFIRFQTRILVVYKDLSSMWFPRKGNIGGLSGWGGIVRQYGATVPLKF